MKLWGQVNPDEYPAYLVEKSAAHVAHESLPANPDIGGLMAEFDGLAATATINGTDDNPLAHVSFAGAGHSFDEDLPGADNQTALEDAREMTLRWLETFLE